MLIKSTKERAVQALKTIHSKEYYDENLGISEVALRYLFGYPEYLSILRCLIAKKLMVDSGNYYITEKGMQKIKSIMFNNGS